jgi:hypothetical protein
MTRTPETAEEAFSLNANLKSSLEYGYSLKTIKKHVTVLICGVGSLMGNRVRKVYTLARNA